MKIRWLAVSFFVFLIVLGAPADAQVPPYRLTGPVLIRPFGDSITFGVGFANPTFCPVYQTWQSFCTAPWALGGGYRGWMTVLATSTGQIAFATEGHQSGGSNLQQWILGTQTHDGYPGFRTDELVPAASWLSFSDITLVHAGTNDIAQGKTADQAVTGLYNVLNALLAQNKKTHLFVAKIIQFVPPASDCPPVNGVPCPNFALLNSVVQQYNSKICTGWINLPPDLRQRVTIVNMHGVLQTSDEYIFDGVHPNWKGYRKMACAWVRAIKNMNPSPIDSCVPDPPDLPDPCQGLFSSEMDKSFTPTESDLPSPEFLERIRSGSKPN